MFVLVGLWAAQAAVTIWLVQSPEGRALMSLAGFIAVLSAAAVMAFAP